MLPKLASDAFDKVCFLTYALHLSLFKDADITAEVLDIGSDVCGEDDRTPNCDSREQIEEVESFLGVETGRGFVDDQYLRLVDYRLRNTCTTEHEHCNL